MSCWRQIALLCLWGGLWLVAGPTAHVVGAADGVGRLSSEQPHRAGEDELRQQMAVLELAEADFRNLQEASTRAGFTTVEFSRLLALMTRAKLAGLPHTQLLKKLEEGLAKGVLPEKIQSALQEKARSLRAAKDIVDQLIMQGWLAPDYTLAVTMVGDALEAGAKPAHVLRAVRDNRPCRDGIPDVRRGFKRAGSAARAE